MKTTKLRSSIIMLGMMGCLAFTGAHGQATIANNVITTVTDYLGSSNDSDVIFKSHGIERARMFAGGNFNFNGSGSTFSAGSSILNIGGAGGSTYQVYIDQTGTGSGYVGLRTDCARPTSAYHNYGIIGTITAGTGYTIGTYGSATGGNNSGRAYGIYGIAGGSASGYNYGVYGTYNGSNNAAGVFGVEGSLSDVDVSGKWAGYYHGRLYADTIAIDTNIEPIKYALLVNGKIRTTNDGPIKPTSGSWSGPSDRRLKTDINKFTDGLNVIRQVNTVTYKYNGIWGLPTEQTNIGVIAQEIQKVAPYCVKETEILLNEADAKRFNGPVTEAGTRNISRYDSASHSSQTTAEHLYTAKILTYNYDGLVYCLINSVKQLDKIVDSLRSAIDAKQPVQTGSITTNVKNVEVTSVNGPILYQNSPNPFGSSGTRINYYLPEGTLGALMVFYDSYGNKLKEEPLTQTGMGSLNITADKLNNGIYTYSLVVNGQIIDTKKMVFAK